MLKTPVLFLIFNRLDTTRQVFEKIREAQPTQLFIGADGPRLGKIGEAEKVAAVRKYVLDHIDWDCEVKTLFREENLGCGIAPYKAIDWFFQHVEAGIILEDDCLPDLSFFTFCEELLHYYKDNEQIMHISGSNFQKGKHRNNFSYYFSNYAPAWGWATWKRAWSKYDFYVKNTSEEQLFIVLKKMKFSKRELKFWIDTYKFVKDGKRPDIWDLQWGFAIWLHHGLSISPQVNLISNIGFNHEATHTTQVNSGVANLKTESLYNIIHPPFIIDNYKADRFTFNNHVLPTESIYSIIRNRFLPHIIPNFVKKIINKIKNEFS